MSKIFISKFYIFKIFSIISFKYILHPSVPFGKKIFRANNKLSKIFTTKQRLITIQSFICFRGFMTAFKKEFSSSRNTRILMECNRNLQWYTLFKFNKFYPLFSAVLSCAPRQNTLYTPIEK